ncbi:MAG: bifunctional folylpolyglutamate synthase/dihydrofolate synthase [Alphaproteobacteria bacterium]
MVYLPHWPIPSTLGKKIIDFETVFERAKIVLERLGNPHQKMPPAIHIAGTNGKGSTSNIIAKIFQCHNYKVHLYTSPHLHNCNERIVINGEIISDADLFLCLEEVRLASAGVDLTFMEGFTIGAFVAFAKFPADILILECGMGARIDITNIVENKIASIITSISLDHQEYLGKNLEDIAFEKCFVAKPLTPLIVSPQSKNVKDIITNFANQISAQIYHYEDDFFVEKIIDEDNKINGNFNFFWIDELLLPNLNAPNLLGDHQYHNCASAIACAMALSDKYEFNFNGINRGISCVKWASRLEKIENNLIKLLKNPQSEIWIDGAHNEGGAFVLNQWLESQPNKKNYVLCGFSKNKCKVNFLNKFNQKICKLVAIRVELEPYPEASEVICEIAKKNHIEIIDGKNLFEAIKLIGEINQDEEVRIVICGSLHLARDVKSFNENFIDW